MARKTIHEKLDFLISKYLDLDSRIIEMQEQMKQMVTRIEFNTKIDRLTVMVKRLDDERIVTNERIARIEAKLYA